MTYNDFNFFLMNFLFGFNPKHARKIFFLFFNKTNKIGFTSKHDDVFKYKNFGPCEVWKK
jgi:hypothetical protein